LSVEYDSEIILKMDQYLARTCTNVWWHVSTDHDVLYVGLGTLYVLNAGLGTRNFYFQDRKKFEIYSSNVKGHFSGHQSHKKLVFVISGAYNFGTFRADAKITIRQHEVVYRLSSERKMIDLE